MSNPKIFIKRKRVRAVIVLGVLLIIIGTAIWLYTNLVIESHEKALNNPNLTQEEKWTWEGSLRWWRTAKATFGDPASMMLVVMGICAVEYTLLYEIVKSELQPERRNKTSQTLLSQFL